jgi:hypothetical protein
LTQQPLLLALTGGIDMAGLLDIFGTGGADTMGLLGMSQADIARNRDDAQAQALYALAGRLFQGGNTGQSIAEGLQAGQKAYKGGMQNVLQEQLQNVQLQDMIRKRKLEQQALAEQQRIQGVIQGAVTKPQEIYGEDMMGQQVGQGMTAGGFDLQRAMPQLMASPEGRKALSELVASQKAMGGETTSLAEGAKLIRVNPITGKVETVAQGAPKQDAMPTSLREFMVAKDNPDYAKFLETQTAAKAPKFAVDLKDPTAIAKAQSDVLKDWRGVVKDTGAMEVADRFKAAKAAVAEANAGNKTADGALIYAIGKIYDPSGAVQEGDKATILGNRSIPQSIKAYAERALSGQSLLPEERAGLLSVATKLVESKARNLEAQKAPYSSISQQLGGNGSLLLNPLADALTAPVQAMPSMADIQAEIARRKKP